MKTGSRRRFLATIAGAITGGLAGCTIQFEGTPPGGGPRSGRRRNYGPTNAGDRFYQGDPPERPGGTINAADYSSIQDAHDALTEDDDTLYIPSHSGPYQDRLEISKSHLTIESDGAWIEQPDRSEGWAIGSADTDLSPDTSLAGPVAGGGKASDGGTDDVGDGVLPVADASTFSPGDDIYITESGRAFGEPSSGGASGPDEIQEYRTVTDVDTSNNTLSVHYPMFLPYPNDDPTEVGRMDWAAEDVHITRLNVRGVGNDEGDHLVELTRVKNAWLDNLRLENAADGSMALTGCYQCRTDGIEMFNGGGYGITIRSGSTHTYCTDSVGDGIVNYTVRVGGSAVDVLAEGVTGRNYRSRNEGPVAASHWGGFFITYRGVTVDGEQLVRYRTRHMTVEDFSVSGTDTREIVWSQRPFHVILRNGDIGNYPSGANETIFHFRLRGNNSPFGNEAAGNVIIEDVRIEQNGNVGPGDIGMFSSGCEIDGLYIRNVTYGDQKLTRQHVEQWDGFGQARISNLVVE